MRYMFHSNSLTPRASWGNNKEQVHFIHHCWKRW